LKLCTDFSKISGISFEHRQGGPFWDLRGINIVPIVRPYRSTKN